jgi:hypothetical protein
MSASPSTSEVGKSADAAAAAALIKNREKSAVKERVGFIVVTSIVGLFAILIAVVLANGWTSDTHSAGSIRTAKPSTADVEKGGDYWKSPKGLWLYTHTFKATTKKVSLRACGFAF